MENRNKRRDVREDQSFNLKDILFKCLSKWYWFVASLGVAVALAVFYILSTPPVYSRTAKVLIKETGKGRTMGSDMMGFEDMGLFRSKSNVQDEMVAFTSPSVMYEVVKRLGLNVEYTTEGRFHKVVMYGRRPIEVSFLELQEEEGARMRVRIDKDGNLKLSDFVRYGEEIEGKPIAAHMYDTVMTPLGKLIVEPTPYYILGDVHDINVRRSGLTATGKNYAFRLRATLEAKGSTIIRLGFEDVNRKRAEDVLNTVIAVYNENWVNDKNMIAVSTSNFINERLAVIEQDLGNVDENISTFKSKNLLPDIQAASNLYMSQSTVTNEKINAINNQLYMSKYVRDYLTDASNKNELLPANTGLEGGNISNQIAEYNKQLLQRMSLVANSSEQNPLVVDIDRALNSMRDAMVSSIDNQIETLNAQLKTLEKTERQATSRLAANPTQAKYLLSVERQQKVKEALYLFLLQKREENELSQAFTAYNTRIIMPPTGGNAPIAPKTQMILLVAIVFGLLIPAVVIFIREITDTRIRGRRDLENLTLPFLGEIPNSGKKDRFGKKKEEDRSAVVKEGKRDVINEAFRVLRANLEFMTENNKEHVILLTSFNPGSGKTFLSANIGASLAIKGNKVVIVDGDMRHASMSAFLGKPEKGLSDYLNGRISKTDDILIQSRSHENMQIIPVGTLPPNPSELLYSKNLEKLVCELKQRFDYVIFDCPPIELVADTQIIEKHVDMTIFVVRAGIMQKALVPEIQKLYEEKKFKNMALVLNGTYSDTGRYSYRYGYHHYNYSYGYHHSYGYGNYYGSDESGK